MSAAKNRKLTNQVNVYLEVGSRRIFAVALDWPGWCRMGRDEATALQALFEYGPRYARILRSARLGFQPPDDISAFVVIQRLKGNATTDFGAPDMAPAGDAQPLADTELRRLRAILKACWRAFDAAVDLARVAGERDVAALVVAMDDRLDVGAGDRGGGVDVGEEPDYRNLVSLLGGQARRYSREHVPVLVDRRILEAQAEQLFVQEAKQIPLLRRAGAGRRVLVRARVDLDVTQEALEQGFLRRVHDRIRW